MADNFDPYLRWLGIRDPQRPPNHYRLLGLELFEEDQEVINEAADRQMGHVRTHQTGPYAMQSQHLLNELARAKVCLLNRGRKSDYDTRLRELITQQKPAASGVPFAAAETSTGSTGTVLVLPSIATSSNPGSLAGSSPPSSQIVFAPAEERSGVTSAPKDPNSGQMGIRLLVRTGPQAGEIFEHIGREAFTVGRSRRATFSVRGDQGFSRVHFSIRLNPPVCYLKNLNEKQGTRVNGRAVNETLLRHGDVISGGLQTKIEVQFFTPTEATVIRQRDLNSQSDNGQEEATD